MAKDHTNAGIAFVAVCVGIGAVLALSDGYAGAGAAHSESNEPYAAPAEQYYESPYSTEAPPPEEWEIDRKDGPAHTIFAYQSGGILDCRFPSGSSLPIEWNAGSGIAIARGEKSSVVGRLINRAGPDGVSDESFIEISGTDDGGDLYLFISADGQLSGTYNGQGLTGSCS